MLKRPGISALVVLSAILLVGTPAHVFAGETDVAAPQASDSLEGNCYLALSPGVPRLFEIEFGQNTFFNTSLCTTEGTYTAGQEFFVFTLWNASCEVDNSPLSFDGLAIASAVLFFQAEGAFNTRGLAFRTPCGVLP